MTSTQLPATPSTPIIGQDERSRIAASGLAPDVAQGVYEKVCQILTREEVIYYIAVQNVFPLNLTPDWIVLRTDVLSGIGPSYSGGRIYGLHVARPARCLDQGRDVHGHADHGDRGERANLD